MMNKLIQGKRGRDGVYHCRWVVILFLFFFSGAGIKFFLKFFLCNLVLAVDYKIDDCIKLKLQSIIN